MVELIPISTDPEAPDEELTTGQDEPEIHHLTVRIKHILPDDRPLVSVAAGDSLAVAITTMLGAGVGQLPVVDGDHVVGAVSWESIAKAQLRDQAASLADATTSVPIVGHDDDLFGRLDDIERNGFVVVRGDGPGLIGVLTANDLARQFGTMARPFSILGEAELRLREQVRRALPDGFAKHTPHYADAPTLGRYKNILDEPAAFRALGWPLDHRVFLDLLARVVKIRNDITHVSKDPLTAQDLNAIESFVAMLRVVDQIG